MDNNTRPRDSKGVELWIHAQITNRMQATFIADELLKIWEQNLLTYEGKQSVGRFCQTNGFFTPLIRALKNDLRTGAALPWSLLIELLKSQNVKIGRKIVDACLSGATRDKQLLDVSATAVLFNCEDPRWTKIYLAEYADRQTKLKNTREDMFQEIKILQQEGMHDDLKESVSRVLSIFPDDVEAKKLQKSIHENELLKNLDIIRKGKRDRPKHRPIEPQTEWPELKNQLLSSAHAFDLDTVYNLAIGLQEMGMIKLAREILALKTNLWEVKENLLAIELMISDHCYAEALLETQTLMKKKSSSEIIPTTLYFLAKSYKGLEDDNQAVSILKALVEHHPEFRDARVLLKEWESEGLE
jgi:tetratricopeptide (TPR) repeat protein